MEKLLSVIIPTYNMESYLHKCLDSLFLSDTHLLELLDVIIVNDGSKDNSSAIAHKYEKQYPGIYRVIDKQNGHYGSCINAALPVAEGKYIKILDADDYFHTEGFKHYLEFLCHVDADLIVNDKMTVNPEGDIIADWSNDITPYATLSFDDVSNSRTVLDMHKMAYRRTLLLDMNYRQTEGVSYTDSEWAIFPFSLIQSAYYIPYKIYCYLQGREGQTIDKAVRSKSLRALKTVQFSLGDFMQNFKGSGDRKNFLIKTMTFDSLGLYEEFFICGFFEKEEFRQFDAELISRYPEIQYGIDNHPWVSFIPKLQLAKDWRERKIVKYTFEHLLIKSYLALSKMKSSFNR